MWVEASNNHLHNANFFTEVYIEQNTQKRYAIIARVVNCANSVVLSDLYDDDERLGEILNEFQSALKIGDPFYSFDVL